MSPDATGQSTKPESHAAPQARWRTARATVQVIDAAALRELTRDYWRLFLASAARVKWYVDRLLPHELEWAEQRGTLTARRCNTPALLAGHSSEPLLQTISVDDADLLQKLCADSLSGETLTRLHSQTIPGHLYVTQPIAQPGCQVAAANLDEFVNHWLAPSQPPLTGRAGDMSRNPWERLCRLGFLPVTGAPLSRQYIPKGEPHYAA